MQFEDFQQHTLANLELAEQEVEAEKLSLPRALLLASVLLSHGHPKAARPINLLKHKGHDEEVRKVGDLFERSFVELRRYFSFEEMNLVQLENFYRTEGLLYLRRKEKSEKLLVIFTTMFNNLGYSNAALTGLFSRLDCDLLFLRDISYFSFLKGAKGIADDFPGVGDKILELAMRNAIERIYLTGYSASGYAALQTSLLIPCHGFLGFSLSIDLRPDSPLHPLKMPEFARQVDPRWLRDLKPLLESADPSVPRAFYYGERHRRDSIHAHYVEDLVSIRTICLPGVHHNTILAFYIDRLLDTFATLIEGRSDWPVPEAANPVAADVEISRVV